MIPICGGSVERCYRVIFWSCFINFIMHDCVVVIVIYYLIAIIVIIVVVIYATIVIIVILWRHVYSTIGCLFTITFNIDGLVFFLHLTLTILLFSDDTNARLILTVLVWNFNSFQFTFRTHSSMCCEISSCVLCKRPWHTGHAWHVIFAYASSSNFRFRSLPRSRPWRFTRIRWNVCLWWKWNQLKPHSACFCCCCLLTSHRLLRLCRLLCTACNSMLSVRRISWRSLYMFGFAKRPNSAEKCDSNSSGDNWMPQIGHELRPVADVAPTCIGFFGPIPGWWKWKN